MQGKHTWTLLYPMFLYLFLSSVYNNDSPNKNICFFWFINNQSKYQSSKNSKEVRKLQITKFVIILFIFRFFLYIYIHIRFFILLFVTCIHSEIVFPTVFTFCTAVRTCGTDTAHAICPSACESFLSRQSNRIVIVMILFDSVCLSMCLSV